MTAPVFPVCADCIHRSECEKTPEDDDRCATYAPEKKHGMRFIRAGEIELRAPDFLVDGYIESATLGVLYGQFGTKKSFAALDIAFSVASGTPWLGRKVRAGPVLYIIGEGVHGIPRRRRAWEIVRGVSVNDAPVFFSSCPAMLANDDAFADLRQAVTTVSKIAGPPVLIIVDTWSRNFGGADENSSRDAAAAVKALDDIRNPYNAAALVVHHSGWDASRTRGSTVLMAAADFAFKVSADGAASVIVGEKMKESEIPPPLAFKLQDVPLGIFDDEGREIFKGAPVHVSDFTPTATAKPNGRPPKEQARILEILESFTDGATLDELVRHLDPLLFAAEGRKAEQARFKQTKRKALDRMRTAGLVAFTGTRWKTANSGTELMGTDDPF